MMLTAGVGAACQWQPGYRPPAKRVGAEMALDLLITEACAEWGFTNPYWWQDGDVRHLELLGPDSPAEYIYTLHRHELVDATVQDMARDLYWWIVARGKVYDHGKFLVPKHQENPSRRRD